MLASRKEGDRRAASGRLGAYAGIITEGAAKGVVTLPGVGKITCCEQPERMARTPPPASR